MQTILYNFCLDKKFPGPKSLERGPCSCCVLWLKLTDTHGTCIMQKTLTRQDQLCNSPFSYKNKEYLVKKDYQ